jgi:single-strand DNA-binding protein
MNQLRNQVQLIGHLGRDPEVKHFANDKIVAKFPLATSEIYRNGQGIKTNETQWHNIVIWGKLAKVAEEYLQKGMQIAIKGKLTHRIYEDKDGMKRDITEIITFDLMMLSTGKKVEKVEREEEFLPF